MGVSKYFATLIAKIPAAEREAYLAQFPKRDLSKDTIVLPQVGTVVQVTHLPVKVVPSQLHLVRSVVNAEKVRRDQLTIEALRTAFGDQIPQVDV
jgi:hypothetical protein